MKNLRFLLAASVASLAVSSVVAPVAHAQETTSTIRGTVQSGGAPVAGAKVEIVDQSTGAMTTVTTQKDGGFAANSLRVGGPYSVKVVADGYSSFEATDVYTIVGQAFNLPVELASSGDEIVVTASAIKGAGVRATAPSTTLTRDQIQLVASYNRDIRDLSRRDPLATSDPTNFRAISFAGQNPRFNRFSVDGVAINDSFGLNPDGLPSRRGPVPLDAIGQFQASSASYDIRQGNFQGGAVDIILLSGTNEFHGTGFYSYSDRGLRGDTLDGQKFTVQPFNSQDYGVELSGPIIKDKLFFTVAAERVRAGNPITFGTADTGAANAVPGLTSATISQIQQIAQSRYNYNTGPVLTSDNDSDDRVIAKIDAHLSDTQRVALTYIYTNDSINTLQGSSTNPSSPSLGLTSNGYIQGNQLHVGIAQWNADWSDTFSTEVRGFYKDYTRIQDPILGRGFAQFQVCTAPTSINSGATDNLTSCGNNASVFFGPDVSRQSNSLNVQNYGFSILPRLHLGNHDIKLLAEYQHQKIFNLFLQRTAGDYYFDSIADFQAGNANRLRYQNATTLDTNDAAARYQYDAFDIGIQDSWRITNTLNVSFGVRYDFYGSNDHALLNQNFVNRYGFVNNSFLSGRGVFQPRADFNWKPTQRLSFRGGLGVFSGGSPDVYFSNSFSNTGVITSLVDIRRNANGTFTGADTTTGNAALNAVNGTTIPSQVNNLLTNATTVAAATTNAIDPHFKIPNQFRASFSTDYTADLGPLGDNWNFGFDLLYNKVNSQVAFTDLRSVATSQTTPDGRTRYVGAISNTDTGQDILLTNTSLGRGYIADVRFEKKWNFGLTVGGSYAYQDVKDQAPATSSTAGSNYGNGAFFDANIAAYGTSNDETKHQFKYYLNYDHAYFGDYRTRIGLFGETRIGRPFSYTFFDRSTSRSAVFGTVGSGSRYLLYVPTGLNDSRVSYDSNATAAALDAFIKSSGLDKYRGQVAPRNAFNSPWFTKVDLHVEQEVPTFLGKSKITLFGDIENLTNLINNKWGLLRQYAFPFTNPVVSVGCLTTPRSANGTATPNTTPTAACNQYYYSNFSPNQTVLSDQSFYTIRIGVRVTF